MSSLEEQVAKLLAGMGVAPTRELDAALDAVQGWLDGNGVDATVASMRWGVIVLEASGLDAYRLSWERDSVLAAARAAGSSCTSIRIRTRRTA